MQYKIIVDTQTRINPTDERKEYTIEIEELRYKDDVYDTLVITFDECYVIRRLSLSKYYVLTVLDEEVIETLENVDIELFKGENYIYLEDLEGNQMSAEYLIDNDFTSLYVTVNQMNSAITQTATDIKLEVNQTLEGYSTTEEMNSVITQTAEEISLEVSKKVGEDEIISKINQTAETIQIEADKISLEGKEISLTSDDITITSNYFNVDKYGNLTCSNATMQGNFFQYDSDGNMSIAIYNNYIYLYDWTTTEEQVGALTSVYKSSDKIARSCTFL